MSVPRQGLARLLAIALLVAPLGACSSLGLDQFSLSSLNPWAKKDLVADEPAEKLYNEGVFLVNEKRDYKEAIKRFEEVDRQHPYSEWARKSLLMTAYSFLSRRANTTRPSLRRSATSRCIPARPTPPMRSS